MEVVHTSVATHEMLVTFPFTAKETHSDAIQVFLFHHVTFYFPVVCKLSMCPVCFQAAVIS